MRIIRFFHGRKAMVTPGGEGGGGDGLVVRRTEFTDLPGRRPNAPPAGVTHADG